jgi:hypothetical protein
VVLVVAGGCTHGACTRILEVVLKLPDGRYFRSVCKIKQKPNFV